MMRPGIWLVVAAVVAGFWVASAPARGASEEDPRTASQFLQGLREKGYYDLAAEYLDAVKGQPDAPLEIKETAEYEHGRLLLDEASRTGDLLRRKDLLDQARSKLDGFTRANPNHPKAPEALVELARLLVERGHLAMLQADETENKPEKEAKLAEARGSFDLARTSYAAAEARLKADFAKFPPYVADDAAHREEHRERERTHTALMQAQLQKAVVDYEQGETFQPGEARRAELMGKALAQFEDLYKRYRLNMAGLTARMWQGKCYEERGELGPAMGIYNELMQHEDPRLRPLQRYVGYFRLIVLAKRQEFALAEDEALRWLQANNTPDALRSKEGLGVQLELAKDRLARLPSVEDPDEKAALIKKATDVLSQVVRYSSPYKAEAVDLLKKYKPRAAAGATDVSKLGYEEATSAFEQAYASQEWGRAVALAGQALRRAESARDADKVNQARYLLALAHYMNKQYYESFVLADHLVRRYPRAGVSAKAAELGIASLAEAYKPSFSPVDRTTDIENLVDFATYLSEAYPEQEEGDAAKLTLGKVYHGTGRYGQAIKAFDSVRAKSAKSVEARTLAGGSHWQESLGLRNKGDAAQADAEVTKAVEALQSALKSRQESGSPPTDPALVGNACDLADIFLETGKAAEALALLDPLAKAQAPPYGPAFPRLQSTLLRAHIANSQVDLAIADMTTLEKAGGGSNLTQLYYNLGKLLEKEMDALKKKDDSAGLNRTQTAYQKFLTALVASKSGQTFDSLYWAGQNMLTLSHPREAQAVFEQILKTFAEDPKFLAAPGASSRLMMARLKLSAAYRGQGNLDEASKLVQKLAEDNPKAIEVLMEKGMLLEDKARSRKSASAWSAAFRQWQSIAMRLGTARTKPVEYYDAWYHAALALNQEGKAKEARATLASVMRLSPTVGGDEMKKKFKALLEQIK